jgi:hypothetical protein
VRDLSFSQWYWWRLVPSGTSSCVDRWIFPYFSKDLWNILLILLGPEDGNTTNLRNVGSYSSNDTVSYPRRFESSASYFHKILRIYWQNMELLICR